MRLRELHRRLGRDEARTIERPLLPLLSAVAGLYRAGVGVRNWLYERGLISSRRIEPPVVSVGGLAAGGSGKTPFAAYVALRVRGWGLRPLLIARGYGALRGRPDPRLVVDGAGRAREGWETAGEEALLLGRLAPGVPVAVGRERAAAFEAAAAELGPIDMVVLDGSFQYRRLHSDLTVVLLDAARRPGTGHLLPRGELREPWGALRRADLLVLHRAELCQDREGWERFLERTAPGRARIWSQNRWRSPRLLGEQEQRSASWTDLSARRLGVWTALGHPEAFRAGLARMGIVPRWSWEAPDHAPFGPEEVDQLRRAAAQERLDGFLVSEKDAIKMVASVTLLPPVYVVPAGIDLGGDAEQLDARLRALRE